MFAQRIGTFDLKLGVDQEAFASMIANIKERLANEVFRVNVVPNVSGGAAAAPGLARGGRIPGVSPHPRADDKLIWATAGEYVQPVSVVKHYGLDFMEQIRRMQFPKFAEGGQIGGGASSASAPAGSVHHLDLTMNKKPLGRVSGSREAVRNLVEMLNEVARGT